MRDYTTGNKKLGQFLNFVAESEFKINLYSFNGDTGGVENVNGGCFLIYHDGMIKYIPGYFSQGVIYV